MVELIGAGLAAGLAAVGAGIGNGFLFGNIYAGEVLLALLATLATAGVFGAIAGITGLVVWKGFSLFIGFIQAYIFTVLSFIYLSHKISDEH